MAFEQVAQWQVLDDDGRRKYLSEDERRRFLEATDQLDETSRLLCCTLALTGCRITEALSLRLHHLDLERLTLTIKTLKRRRVVFRAIPIPPTLAADLAGLPVDSEGLFWLMHRATAWRLVKRMMDQAGIAGPMACCKGLRHGFDIRAAGPPRVRIVVASIDQPRGRR